MAIIKGFVFVLFVVVKIEFDHSSSSHSFDNDEISLNFGKFVIYDIDVNIIIYN